MRKQIDLYIHEQVTCAMRYLNILSQQHFRIIETRILENEQDTCYRNSIHKYN
jgi:hypothetical protein